jgi:hypothetical protein
MAKIDIFGSTSLQSVFWLHMYFDLQGVTVGYNATVSGLEEHVLL